MVCKKVFGEKEPLDDKSPTHGICGPCFEEFRVKSEEHNKAITSQAREALKELT
jgi:hypothetical protein